VSPLARILLRMASDAARRAEPGRLLRRRSLEYFEYSALRSSLHPTRLRSAGLGPSMRNGLLVTDRHGGQGLFGLAQDGLHLIGRESQIREQRIAGIQGPR
jgi:hypothetical protein